MILCSGMQLTLTESTNLEKIRLVSENESEITLEIFRKWKTIALLEKISKTPGIPLESMHINYLGILWFRSESDFEIQLNSNQTFL